MHIITKRPLREFWEKYPDAENALRAWYKIADKIEWENIVDVRRDFPHADFVGVCTIFNIGGNKYRLITKISYRTKKIFVRFVLTHAEYDKGIYKNNCEC